MAPIAAVIVHELGHYWAARGAGMRVEAIVVFGIGWDFVQKRLYRERQANVGGYVRANSQYLTEREHRHYVLGGPMMNLAVFALVIPLLRFAPPLKSKRSFFPSLARTERWLSSTCCHLTRAGSHPMVDNSAICSAVGATTSGKSWRRSLRFASA